MSLAATGYSRAFKRLGRHSRKRLGLTAARLLSRGQLILLLVGVAALVGGLLLAPKPTLAVLVALCMTFYVSFALLKLVVSIAGKGYRPPPMAPVRPDEPGLPRYAVLLPVHKEANMLRHLVARVSRLEYPKDRLRVMLLIEHDDLETLSAARALGLRFQGQGAGPGRRELDHVAVVVIPPGGPKTKPNAMNVAMDTVVAEGCELLTIYDAEDRPDPDQLLKAVGTFRAAPDDVACLQAELAFWNDDTNWVTALYWIGYKIHFLRFLPGLARLGLPIPLGGTSNHFRVSALLDAALFPGGSVWDAHNLTEDADLGARLVSEGYRIELLASTTMEEAPISSKVVDKQQRRWKGGYLQTGLVHTRKPIATARTMGPVKWLCFNLMMLGTPLSFLINPLFLALTCTYFATHAAFIGDLFPTAVYYPSLALLVAGNFTLLYEMVLVCLEEAHRTRGRFRLVRYMFLAQVMWLWMSRSTYIAVFELFTGKRGWHKTPHGHAEADADDMGLPDFAEFPVANAAVAETMQAPEHTGPEHSLPRPTVPAPRHAARHAAPPDNDTTIELVLSGGDRW